MYLQKLLDTFMKERDIAAKMSDEDAHVVYAEIVKSFLILQNQVSS